MERLKSYAILLLAICLMCFAYYSHTLKRDLALCRAPHPPMPEVSAVLTSPVAVPIIDTYTDAAGKQHAVIVDAQTRDISRQKALDITSPFLRIIDSQAKALQVKPQQIESYLAVQLKVARDSVRFLTKAVEAGVQTRTFKDQFLSLVVREALPADSADTTDNTTFDFAYDADLKFVEYSKQKKFLGIPISARKYYTDISSSDPRLRIKGVEKFTIQRRVPALGFRVQALTTYNFDTHQPAAGVGTRFDIGERFNLGVNYLYNFSRETWVPAGYAKYDILQFGR